MSGPRHLPSDRGRSYVSGEISSFGSFITNLTFVALIGGLIAGGVKGCDYLNERADAVRLSKQHQDALVRNQNQLTVTLKAMGYTSVANIQLGPSDLLTLEGGNVHFDIPATQDHGSESCVTKYDYGTEETTGYQMLKLSDVICVASA